MNKRLNEILSLFKDKRIVVWGDLILDEYIYTTTSRISREAPVLVTEFESNEFRLGGAGNVVMNIHALGAVPIPVGFIGNNADGEVLKDLLRKNGITTDFLVQLDGYRTPKKSRIMSGGENTKKQQVLRIDAINKADIKKNAYQKLESTLLELLKEVDHYIISDYICKSVTIDLYNRITQQRPSQTSILDSRYHLPKFKNISIATPNEPEIRKIFPTINFLDQQDFVEAGRKLIDRLNARGIILKRGHKGMLVFDGKQSEPARIGIHGSDNIVDVTGAGDTVISVVGLSLAAGADLVSAAQLATVAAGMVVMKEGAYPISVDDLKNELIKELCHIL
jgi:D-glycero-beta-D-manno-heptose-7-phosphate kinase